MAVAQCTNCGSSDIALLTTLPDTRKHVECLDCGHDWVRGEATRVIIASARGASGEQRRFPRPSDVPPERLAQVAALRASFLTRTPEPDPDVAPHWQRYQQVFSADGLRAASPEDLRDFANTPTGANPGSLTAFNAEWDALGPVEAAQRVRDAVRFLLYGSDRLSMPDRLTRLIRRSGGLGMKGLGEALLTKVLCVVQPERFLPILVYGGVAGKREIAESVYGLSLPPTGATSMTQGRLVIWSNDLLRELVGDGFETPQHAAQFLREAKNTVAAGR